MVLTDQGNSHSSDNSSCRSLCAQEQLKVSTDVESILAGAFQVSVEGDKCFSSECGG
jgi:hypothetical protein